MKKALVILMLLTLLCAAALAEETVLWQGYDLQATWLTTDPADINIPNLRADGQFALVRLEPAEGTVGYEKVNEHAGDDLFIRLASGEKMPLGTVLFHNLIQPEGGGFPSINPEQENFDALFFLEGGTEADLDGAMLVVLDGETEQTLSLSAISREKP